MTKPHLTLVDNTTSQHGRAEQHTLEVLTRPAVKRRAVCEQLDLFDRPILPNLLVLIVAMDTVHGRTLQNAVLAHKPKSVIDLRFAARFDQYGSDRDTLFAYFRSVGSYYALDSLPWHNLCLRDFMSEEGVCVPRAHHELVELDNGAVMFFVPKPQHANMLTIYFNRLLSVKSKSSWQIEQIG